MAEIDHGSMTKLEVYAVGDGVTPTMEGRRASAIICGSDASAARLGDQRFPLRLDICLR
jgi:hypothetical protein